MKIVVLIFFVIFQSYVLEKKKICDYSIIHRIYDCDSVNNLWKSSFELGIRQLDIRNINIVKENNRIYVTAQIIDKQSKEPMPYSLVYKLTGDDINCNIKKLPF